MAEDKKRRKSADPGRKQSEYGKSYYDGEERELDFIIKDRDYLPVTYHVYLGRVMKYCRTGRLLDFGCGPGFFLKLANRHYSTFGIDISQYSIDETKKRVPAAAAIVGGTERLDEFNDGYFDVITAIDVLEHLEEPSKVIGLLNRKLKSGGVFLINVPNTTSMGKRWKGKNWFAYRDRGHKSILPSVKWTEIIVERGFTIREKYYDGLWDSPYLPGIPDPVQHLVFKLPSVILLPFYRFPEKLGENICIISTKI